MSIYRRFITEMYIRGDLGSSELPIRTSLNESGIPSKFWWMDSNGDLISVTKFGHAESGKQILRKKYGIESESTFEEMYKKGYIRVGFVGLWGQYNLEINYIRSNPPSSKQWKALKDLAVETGADSIRDDTSGREVRVNESRILFENFQENKEWFIYEGDSNITVVFEDNSRRTFKIHFHKNRGPDRDKWRTKAARTWKKLAMEFRKNAGLTEVGNPIVIPWQECFKEALNHPEMKEYVDDLRATPIFEWVNDLRYIWLSKNGEQYNVPTHERGGSQILQDMGLNPNNYPGSIYDQLYQRGFARVVVYDTQYPLMVDTGTMGQPKLTKAQKKWLEDKSFELGLDGEYYNASGRPVKENLCEMSYDDLLKSMKNYRIRRGGGGRTVRVGDNGREERSKHVRVKPLTVKSTVGKDGQERETSLFSYTSEAAWRTGGTEGTGHHGYIRFLESFDKGKEGDVEVNCNCFSGDTLVLMSSGTYKPIKDIKPGDSVYTHKGRIRPVIGNVARKVNSDENVFKIKVCGFHEDVIVTGGHPFYTLRGNTTCKCGCKTPLNPQTFTSLSPTQVLSKKYMQNHSPNKNWASNEIIESVLLSKKDGIKTTDICKKYNLSKSSVRNILLKKRSIAVLEPNDEPFQWIKVENFRNREWFLSPNIEEGNGKDLDTDLARFLGYYAAEGNLSKNRDDVAFTFHLSELETLGKDSIDISKKLGDLCFRTPAKYKNSERNYWKVCRHDSPNNARIQQCFSVNFHITKSFKQFIETHIGHGSKHKKLSEWFMSLNNEILKQFIIGVFLGDGTIKENGQFRFTSISRNLIYNVSTILRRLKIDHLITNIGTKGLAVDVNYGSSVKQLFKWLKPHLRENILTRISESKDKPNYSFDDGYLKVLRKIEKIEYKDEVWDLCVEEDHSFIVAGVAVSNCKDYRYVWAKPNADAGVGTTKSDGDIEHYYPQFKGGGNDNIGTTPRIRNPGNVVGLCIAKGELVNTKSGFVPIEDIKIGTEVWTLNGWNKVTNHQRTGNTKIISLELSSGKTIKLTSNHPVLAFNEDSWFSWIEAGNLAPDDFLCETFSEDTDGINEKFEIDEYFGDKLYYPKCVVEKDETIAELMGYMISEGSRHGVFSNYNSILNNDFYGKWCQKFGSKSCTIRNYGCYVGMHGEKILEDLGFIPGSYFKEVPSWIMKSNKSIVIAFLRGCYAGDGNFRNSHSTYATVSELLARNIHLLLGSIGVRSAIKCYKSGVNKSLTWVVRTSSKEETEKLFSFLNPIRGYSSTFNKTIKEKQTHFSRNDYIIKNGKNFFSKLLEILHLEFPHKSINQLKRNLHLPENQYYKIHKNKISSVLENVRILSPTLYDKLLPLSKKNITLVKVNKIISIPEPVDVYDLTVDISEHFTVNGIVVHNCKHLMAIADYLDTKAMPAVAKVDGAQEKPSPVAPTKPKKPINIFETMKQFALQNPEFKVDYED